MDRHLSLLLVSDSNNDARLVSAMRIMPMDGAAVLERKCVQMRRIGLPLAISIVVEIAVDATHAEL